MPSTLSRQKQMRLAKYTGHRPNDWNTYLHLLNWVSFLSILQFDSLCITFFFYWIYPLFAVIVKNLSGLRAWLSLICVFSIKLQMCFIYFNGYYKVVWRDIFAVCKFEYYQIISMLYGESLSLNSSRPKMVAT